MKMARCAEIMILELLCLLVMLSVPNVLAKGHESNYNPKQWCVADEQQPDDVLQKGLDWACGPGHANCTLIQLKMPCYLPNSVKHHASFAFNSYWQKFKKQGATCDFHASAMVTEVDPSDGSCKFEFTP